MKLTKGHVAVVTGAASGIGLATATAFAERGASVVLSDVEEEALTATASALQAKGHTVLAVRTDVSDESDVISLAEQAIARFGKVNVLHNNAGVVVNGLVQEIPQGVWDWVVGVNYWAALYGIRAFLPLIELQGSGHIISTASTAGLQANARIGPYNVSKAALIALSETLRLELAERESPIGVTVVCPGPVKTAIVDADRNRPEALDLQLNKIQQEFKADRARNLQNVGIDASTVADLILAAMEEGRFWALTHPEWAPLMVERANSMAP